ncbi:MAG: hypothetical protein J6Y94_06230, partial [Bacteriovoracaceae bacterium]|nr:hypothetical protein [Bacteriovoracaceae bacterium]
MSTRRLVIMDISNLIFRAFYAIPHLSTSDGMPVNAVSGVLSMFLKMLSGCRPSHILVAQEAPGKNFREELDERYKAQRPPPPDALKVQFDLIDELLNHLQVKHLSVAGMEADDVIASATEQWKDQVDDVLIMSSDKDLMQLVGGKVFLLDTMKDQTLGRAEVFAKLGVWPEQVADYLAMVGDTSDNVKGLPGVGAKTAAKLLAQYQNLSACLEHGAEVKNKKVQDAILNHAADAQLAYKLVSLVRDMKLPIALDACAYQFDFTPDLSAFLKRLELKQQHKRLEDLEYNLAMAKQLEAGGDAPAASPSPKFTLKIDPSSSSTITAAPAAGENLLVPLKVLSEANLAEFLTAYQHNEFASMAIIWPHDLAEDAYPFGLKSSQLMVGLADATWLIEDPFLEKIWDKLFVAASSSAPEIIASSYKEFWHWAANRGQTLPRPTAEKGKGLPFLDVQQAYYVAGGLGKHDLRTMLKALLPQENDLLQALFKEDEDWALAVKRSKSTSKKVPAAQIDWPLLQQRRGRWACCGLRKMVAVLRKQLVEREVQTIYSDIDLPLMPILASMEREGVKINPAFFAQMEKTLQAQLEDIEKSVKKISEQKEVNFRTPKQVAQ